jgi:hypothetical protein
LKWPNSVVWKKRDVLHLIERTDTCVTTVSDIMPPEKLQVDRITNLSNHTPARINKKTTQLPSAPIVLYPSYMLYHRNLLR